MEKEVIERYKKMVEDDRPEVPLSVKLDTLQFLLDNGVSVAAPATLLAFHKDRDYHYDFEETV